MDDRSISTLIGTFIGTFIQIFVFKIFRIINQIEKKSILAPTYIFNTSKRTIAVNLLFLNHIVPTKMF